MNVEELVDAARRGDSVAVDRLLRADPALAAKPAATGETPLMAALYRGQHRVVEAIAEALERHGTMDIFAAAALGRLEALEKTLGGDVNVYAFDGWTPLHLAAFFGRGKAAERLLQAGADIQAVSRNALRNTPLHAAVAGGHTGIALMLIERGAPVNVADAGGYTPLHIAAEAGNLEVARALLARGADPHAVDLEDRTPLARAAARNHDAVVDLFNENA